MATYGYRAITKAGKEVKGSLEADNKDLAMAELRRQELTVIDLGEQSFLTKDIDIQIGGWPKARDLSVMCRQFAGPYAELYSGDVIILVGSPSAAEAAHRLVTTKE